MFNFTPLLGVQSESPASQSLLELDGGVKVLVDVGWDCTFDVGKLKELEKQVPTLSIVLLTHATIDHIGAFAHCCKHIPLFTRVPIYATTPVISLGRTLLQDLYASTPLAATTIPVASLSETSFYPQAATDDPDSHILLQPPTREEIASCFSLIHPLKYSQPHQPLQSPFSPPLNGLTITAYNAGHTLGGTIWHIQHGLESIVYAVDWNQARENVLAGAAWLGGAGAGGVEVIEQLRKPTALICSSRGAERVALTGGRSKRDDLLLDSIKSVVAQGGTVLIPSDSSARVLELAYLLEHAWRKDAADNTSPLRTAKLYLASRNGGATMRYVRSMLEWMDDNIIREFEATAEGIGRKQNGFQEGRQGRDAGPFDFTHLRLLERKTQIEKALSGADSGSTDAPKGKVFLASDTSLEWGFSREILHRIASDERNLVILTERSGFSANSASGSLAGSLLNWWDQNMDGVEENSSGKTLDHIKSVNQEFTAKEAKQFALDGDELQVYQQWLATQRQLQTTIQTGLGGGLEGTVDAVDDASSESSEDSDESDTEQQGRALNISTALGQANRKKIGLSDEDLGINVLLRRKGVHDFDVRGKKGREKMFPVVIRRKRTDDYGDVIRPEDYLRTEERDGAINQEGSLGLLSTKDSLGKKRRWDDVADLGNAAERTQPTDDLMDSTMFDGETSPDLEEDEDDDSYEPEEEISGPSKIVFSTFSLTVKLRLTFIDFAGLHDKRSLQMLIPLIQPRKLILVNGMDTETQSLAEDCRKLLVVQGQKSFVDVYTPTAGTTIVASVDTNAWTVKLTDSLVKRLKWQNVKGLGIVTLSGRLAAASLENNDAIDAERDVKKQKKGEAEAITTLRSQTRNSDHSSALPELDIVPPNMASAVRSAAQPLHVGDLRLADLRRIMQSSGHTAEFRGEGTLVIDGTVAVRKTGTGRIEVESTGLSIGIANTASRQGSTFFAVRKKIYEGLAVVAGI